MKRYDHCHDETVPQQEGAHQPSDLRRCYRERKMENQKKIPGQPPSLGKLKKNSSVATVKKNLLLDPFHKIGFTCKLIIPQIEVIVKLQSLTSSPIEVAANLEKIKLRQQPDVAHALSKGLQEPGVGLELLVDRGLALVEPVWIWLLSPRRNTGNKNIMQVSDGGELIALQSRGTK